MKKQGIWGVSGMDAIKLPIFSGSFFLPKLNHMPFLNRDIFEIENKKKPRMQTAKAYGFETLPKNIFIIVRM